MKKLVLIIIILFTGNAMASSLPSCSSTSVRWHNCFGTYIFPKDSEWAGDKHTGVYKDDERNGLGIYTHANGDIYIGEFKDGKKHGQGAYTWANGEKYVGDWKDNFQHWQGIFVGVGGDMYVGDHKDDKRNGLGTYSYADGDIYVGEYKDGKRHGQGIFTDHNGIETKGYFMNGFYVPNICENSGLIKGTESFGQCVVELIKEINNED